MQITSSQGEKIILGIDPGTSVLGYGIIKVQKDQVHILQYGVLNLSKYTTQGAKFLKIHERILGI
jgi:crossover junction endodeoxyribonuclease RuvC